MTEVPETATGELMTAMAKLRAEFDQMQRDVAALQTRILPVRDHVQQHWLHACYWPALPSKKPTVILLK